MKISKEHKKAGSAQTLESIYKITLHHIPEDRIVRLDLGSYRITCFHISGAEILGFVTPDAGS
jgi:hypothetical protein